MEGLGELIPGVGQRAGNLHVGGTPVGAVAAAAAPAATPVAAAFLRALPVIGPVHPHVPDGTGVVVDVKLLLTEREPTMYHGVQPQLSLQQFFRDDESRHGHVEGEMHGDDFVASENAANDHRLCLNVNQFIAVTLADEVEVVLVARRGAWYRDVDREARFLHNVPDGVFAILHLKLQWTASAKAAFTLERQADALVGAVVHADQARHLAPADLTDGVQFPDLLENSVEPGFLPGRLGVEDLSLAHQRQLVAGAEGDVINLGVFVAFP